MLVLKNNYKGVFPIFKESLESCDFLSFDCEMTGLTLDLKTDPTRYDTPHFRYYKFREVVKKFELIQIGITFFIRKDSLKEDVSPLKSSGNQGKHYIERTFTFFLFKNSNLRFLSEGNNHKSDDSVFSSFTTCHPASMKFLNENNFDLNNLVTNGIHFNKLSYKEKIQKEIKNHIEEGKLPNSILYPSQKNEEILIGVIRSILAFLLTKGELHTDCKKISDKKMIITNLNKFVINYILSINFKKMLKLQNFNLSRDKNDAANLIVEKSKVKLNEEEFNKNFGSFKDFNSDLNLKQILKAKYSLFEERDREDLLLDEMGFSRFIDLLIKKNLTKPVPIVGHNILFDLLFIYDKFIEDLPENFDVFRFKLNKIFPIIYDNKFVTSKLTKEFENTKLESLYRNMKKSKYDTLVDIKPDVVNGFSCYHELDSGSSFHDAGYDSVITGRCFAYLVKALQANFKLDDDKTQPTFKGYVDLSLVQKYANKTGLSMIEPPFDTCRFGDFPSPDEELKLHYQMVYAVVLNKSEEKFYTIYDFARMFENNSFNISVVKIDDNVSFIEFIPVEQNFEDESQKMVLLNSLFESLKTQNEAIEEIYSYSDFLAKFPQIIKF